MSSKNRTIYEKTLLRGMRKKLRIAYSIPRNSKILSSAFLIFFLVLPITAGYMLQSPYSKSLEITSKHHLAAETPTLSLTFYSRFNETPTPVESGTKLSGDHVILNATWTPADNVDGTMIQVNAPAIPSVISAEGTENTVEIDTRLLGNNATCRVNVTTWLTNGTLLSEIFTEVFIGNFFAPHIELLTPNGGENWTSQHNITWIAWDKNTDDVLSYEVLLSSDGGTSFQLLASEVITSWLVWDFSGFLRNSDSIIEVRVTDGIYTASDLSDAVFVSGGIVPTFTTTETTTTNPTAPPASADMRVGYFVAAAILASAFLSLIVYQQAKKLS